MQQQRIVVVTCHSGTFSHRHAGVAARPEHRRVLAYLLMPQQRLIVVMTCWFYSGTFSTGTPCCTTRTQVRAAV
jgi:hypothetical protein